MSHLAQHHFPWIIRKFHVVSSSRFKVVVNINLRSYGRNAKNGKDDINLLIATSNVRTYNSSGRSAVPVRSLAPAPNCQNIDRFTFTGKGSGSANSLNVISRS